MSATTRAAGRTYQPWGIHALAELWGIDPRLLRSARRLERALLSALAAAGVEVVGGPLLHRFRQGGMGVTGAVLLKESHAAFHTYPEAGCMLLDVYVCGGDRARRVVDAVVAALAPARVERRLVRRGARRVSRWRAALTASSRRRRDESGRSW